MKVRVIGTSFEKYINNYLAFPKHVKKIALPQNFQNDNYLIVNDENKNEELMSFAKPVTRRQNIEVWKALELINFQHGKADLIVGERNREAIIEIAKKALLKTIEDEKIQELRNMRLLCIRHLLEPLTNEDIKTMNIKQLQGDLSVYKIKRETSKFEKNLIKDKDWVKKAMRCLNEKIKQ